MSGVALKVRTGGSKGAGTMVIDLDYFRINY